MANSESFIDEVTEEVRRDRLFALYRRYGWIGILAVVAIVGGTIYVEWGRSGRQADAQTFGDGLLAALQLETPEARKAALAEVPASGPQLAVRDLLLASDPATDRAGTLAALETVAADASLPQSYRDLAVLRRVILAGTDLDIPARRALLDPIAIPGRPFRTLALEQVAYLAVEAGDNAAAVEQLRALTQDQEATAGLRRRAEQMIEALGGGVANG